MSCRSPGWPSCGRTLCAMTTERGPRPVVDVRPTPAARRTARWAGTTAGMTWTTTMTSTSRSRRPVRTHGGGPTRGAGREGLDVGAAAGNGLLPG